jgi:hypothetical protein
MKNTNFWDVTPFGCCRNRRFGGKYRPNYQGDKIFRAATQSREANSGPSIDINGIKKNTLDLPNVS